MEGVEHYQYKKEEIQATFSGAKGETEQSSSNRKGVANKTEDKTLLHIIGVYNGNHVRRLYGLGIRRSVT